MLVGGFALDLAGEGVDEIVLRLQTRRRLDAFADLQICFAVEIRRLDEGHRLRLAKWMHKEEGECESEKK